jgi:hypothetical protein
MDPLSEAIALLDGRHSLFSRLEAGGTWAIDFDGYRHAKFGAVLRGSCRLVVEGVEEPVRLAEHDCCLVGNGRSYRLASSLEAPAVHAPEVFASMTNGTARWGTGTAAVMIGGRIDLDEMDTAALAGMPPPLVHVPAGSESAEALHALLRLLERVGLPERESAIPRFGTRRWSSSDWPASRSSSCCAPTRPPALSPPRRGRPP